VKRQLKLITSDQSTPAKSQLTKPCSDCPFSRESFRGWLGPATAEQWIAGAHGEGQVPCHVHPNVQCAGMAIFRANVCKVPRDEETLHVGSVELARKTTDREFSEAAFDIPTIEEQRKKKQ
jgi:hypothetical protein